MDGGHGEHGSHPGPRGHVGHGSHGGPRRSDGDSEEGFDSDEDTRVS